MSTKEDVESAFRDAARKIGLPITQDKLQFQDDGMATPYIDLKDNGEISYVVKERGVELTRKQCVSIDVALYYLFSWITHDLASDYTASHDKLGMDSRRLLFKEQLRLLKRASNEWKVRREAEIGEILRKAPYRDESL
ncbi:Imm63 family immunity protein [Rhizobium sp. 1399]|uniref:Imm63 family immunity protein n=1 Tax=Rhizobium sp. 1399 TaxID=2817758 RepID=UPI0028567A42|nr:Imm63 family immunity protein [Rhizobium sp. 1399]MDR6671024.1 hypothetical protein [Rhizobium sp. 1399]